MLRSRMRTMHVNVLHHWSLKLAPEINQKLSVQFQFSNILDSTHFLTLPDMSRGKKVQRSKRTRLRLYYVRFENPPLHGQRSLYGPVGSLPTLEFRPITTRLKIQINPTFSTNAPLDRKSNSYKPRPSTSDSMAKLIKLKNSNCSIIKWSDYHKVLGAKWQFQAHLWQLFGWKQNPNVYYKPTK